MNSRCESKQDINIYLEVGEAFFGHAPKTIKTLLGSCIAVTVWHKKLKVGGVCHYLLSQSDEVMPPNKQQCSSSENYRYGLQALNYLYMSMEKYSAAAEFEIRLFGGSNMYASRSTPSIGECNVNFAKAWVKENNLSIKQEDVLGNICRTIVFNLSNGKVALQRYKQEG